MRVPNRALLLEHLVQILREEVARAGSQAEWARRSKVNAPDLSSAVRGKRSPTRDILRALHLRKVFAYQQLSDRTQKLLGLDDVVALLREEVLKAGGQAEWARKRGVNRPNLNTVINGKRPPMNDVLRGLGLQKVFAYEWAGKPQRRRR